MKKAIALLLPFFLFLATQSSFAIPVDTNQYFEKEKKQTPNQVWIENYDTEIQVIDLKSKEPIEIMKQNKRVEIINTINSAYDIDSNYEKHTKLGALKFNGYQVIQLYLTKDKESVFLYLDKKAKVLTTERFYEMFKQSSNAEPIPPGFEPKVIPPLPKGEGIGSKDLEKLHEVFMFEMVYALNWSTLF